MQVLSVIIGALILCSCGEKSVNVPGQEVSFMSPPSGWEVKTFTSTSKVPAGGFLPIKFFQGRWEKKNLSTIGITGVNISGIRKEGETRQGLLKALESELNGFRNVCGHVNHTIVSESNGTLRKNVDFTVMEAVIQCYFSNPDNPLEAKTMLLVIESMDYIYTLQFKAVAKFYDQDIIDFKQLLSSITFAGQ